MATIRDALLALKAGTESDDNPLTMYDEEGGMSDAAQTVCSAYDELLAAIDACQELIRGDGTDASLQRTIDLARKALGLAR